MKFHDRRFQLQGRFDLTLVWIDKERDPDTCAVKLGNRGLNDVPQSRRVESALRCQFGSLFRHQTTSMRNRLKRDRGHFFGSGHLQIERSRDFGFQPADIAVANMPPVFAKMRRNSVRPCLDREFRGADRIRRGAAARISKGRNMVDIHAETDRVAACGQMETLQHSRTDRLFRL